MSDASGGSAVIPESVHRVLGHAIDYAGLFPPAAISMADAVANYREYRCSPEAWALGRFILPAVRWAEWLDVVDRHPDAALGWKLSITLGDDHRSDLAFLGEAESAAKRRGAVLDGIEGKVASPGSVATLAMVTETAWYAEVPLGPDVRPFLDAIAAAGGRAKIRMGGVTAEAFPPADRVAVFLREAAMRALLFKATAGLHHPLRAPYRLTYASDAPVAMMYGYLNLLVAAALAESGRPLSDVVAALEAVAPADLLGPGGLAWRGVALPPELVERLATRFEGFGSCSFREPMDELLMLMTR